MRRASFVGLNSGDFEKGQFRNPPAFLPRPLLRAGREPRQGESISPVICLALSSPFRFLLRDFPQNTFELCLTDTATLRSGCVCTELERRVAVL